MTPQEDGLTDKAFDAMNRAMRSIGGFLNPWVWIASLVIIYLGQMLAVQIFLWVALAISAYFTWFHGDDSAVGRYFQKPQEPASSDEQVKDS
jgi:hypothetical protein